MNASDRMCDLCIDSDESNETENVIFTCRDCGLSVHELCYGIEGEEKENWKCSLCANKCTGHVSCEFCLQKEGAMKQTSCGNWVHVICALFTDGVVFEDVNRMEPVNISKVSKTKMGQTCAYCHEVKGYCCLCSKRKCKNRIHITCAEKANGLKEDTKKDGSIKFRAYCADHKPDQRRLSSSSLRVIAKTMKKADEQKKEIGSKMNSDWIMQSCLTSSENATTNDQEKELNHHSKKRQASAEKEKGGTHKKSRLNLHNIQGNFFLCCILILFEN